MHKENTIKPGAHEARCRGGLPLREIPPIDPRDLKHEHVHRVPHKSTHYTIWKSSRDIKKSLIQKLFGVT